MLAVNVSQLLKLPTGTRRTFDFSDEPAELTADVELAAPIEGHARLLRTARGILASSQYRTAVRQACGRCLEAAVSEIRGESSDEFMPKLDVVTGRLLAEQAETDELVIDEHHLLDLTEIIRQDILTRLPLQPLCRLDCPGLCPECGEIQGADHDERSHSSATGGSPFAALADLLRNGDASDSRSDAH